MNLVQKNALSGAALPPPARLPHGLTVARLEQALPVVPHEMTIAIDDPMDHHFLRDRYGLRASRHPMTMPSRPLTPFPSMATLASAGAPATPLYEFGSVDRAFDSSDLCTDVADGGCLHFFCLQKSDKKKIPDANDESLQRYKESLGLGGGKDISDPNDPRVCIIVSLTMETAGRPPVTIELSDAGSEKTLKDKPFKIKEGAKFTMSATFKVQHEILSGLHYVQVVKRKGIRVSKDSEMIVSEPGPSLAPFSSNQS